MKVIPLMEEEPTGAQPVVPHTIPWTPPAERLRILFLSADYTGTPKLAESIEKQREHVFSFARSLNGSRQFHLDYARVDALDMNIARSDFEQQVQAYLQSGTHFDWVHIATHGSPNGGLYWSEDKLNPAEYCVDVVSRLSPAKGAVLVLSCCDSEVLGRSLALADKYYCVYSTKRPLTAEAASDFAKGLYGYLARSLLDPLEQGHSTCLIRGLQHAHAMCQEGHRELFAARENILCARSPFVALLPCLSDQYRAVSLNEFQGQLQNHLTCVRFLNNCLSGGWVPQSRVTFLQGNAPHTVAKWFGLARHVSPFSDGCLHGQWLHANFEVVLVISITELLDANLDLELLLHSAFGLRENAHYVARELRWCAKRVLWVFEWTDDMREFAGSGALQRLQQSLTSEASCNMWLPWLHNCFVVGSNHTCLSSFKGHVAFFEVDSHLAHLEGNRKRPKIMSSSDWSLDDVKWLRKWCESLQDAISEQSSVLFDEGLLYRKTSLHEKLSAALKQLKERLSPIWLDDPFVTSTQQFLEESVGVVSSRIRALKESKSMLQIANTLRKSYMAYKLDQFGDGIRSLPLRDTYLSLSLVEPDKGAEQQAKKTKHQEALEYEKRLKAVNVESLLAPGKRIVLLGRAGGGKSTLCLRIAQQWAEGSLEHAYALLVRIKLIHLVPLIRAKNGIITWEDVVLQELFGAQESRREEAVQFWKWSEQHPLDVFWVLDGYDEIEDVVLATQCVVLKKIVAGELPGVQSMLITSRPEVKVTLKGDVNVEVVGFSDTDVERYIRNRMSDPSRLEKVFQMLERNEWLRNALHTPINLELVCLVLESCDLEGRVRMSQIYQDVVDLLLDRSRATHGWSDEIGVSARRTMQQMAWESFRSQIGYVDGRSFRTKSEPIQNCIRRTGLFKQIGTSQLLSTYFWSHFTFQEYLAAEWACSVLPPGEIGQQLGAIRAKLGQASNSFFLFVAGMGPGEVIAPFLLAPRVRGTSFRECQLQFQWIVNCMMENPSGELRDRVCESEDKEHLALIARFAAQMGDEETVKNLAEKSIGLFESVRGAAYGGHLGILEFLIPASLPSNHADPSSGSTALHFAASGGRAAIITWLVEEQLADVNVTRRDGATPLHLAVLSEDVPSVEYLTMHGARVNAQKMDGETPLFSACVVGNATIVRHLLNCNGSVALTQQDGWTPLHVASENTSNLEIVQLLVQQGASVVEMSLVGLTPLHCACSNGCLNIGAYLISRGANVNLCNLNSLSPNRSTALHCAVGSNSLSVVQLLLQSQADVDRAPIRGRTALGVACERGHLEIVQCLLDHRANVHLAFSDGSTPLSLAKSGQNPRVEECLILRGAQEGSPPTASLLCLACRQGDPLIVQQCIDAGESLTISNSGEQPLLIACQFGHLTIVELLLNNKVDPNFTNDFISPLHMACRNGHLEVAGLLLLRGARVDEGTLKETHWRQLNDVVALLASHGVRESPADPVYDCHIQHRCTYMVTGSTRMWQRAYHCIDCWPDDSRFVLCYACAEHCHKSHRTKEVPFEDIYCDCYEQGHCHLIDPLQ